MLNLRGSLEDMVEANASAVLAGEGTAEGREALLRMTLLLTMIERLESGGDSWERCDMLPDMIPIPTGFAPLPDTPLPN